MLPMNEKGNDDKIESSHPWQAALRRRRSPRRTRSLGRNGAAGRRAGPTPRGSGTAADGLVDCWTGGGVKGASGRDSRVAHHPCGPLLGAWLGFIFAARHPHFVKKLILISSGGFEEKYAAVTQGTRLSRLSDVDRAEANRLLEIFRKPSSTSNDGDFARLGALFSRAGAYDPLPEEPLAVDFSLDVYKQVWKEATELRRSGKLLDLGKKIRAPVVAIHGEYDAHSFEGVKMPLSTVLKDFRFILLAKCGHKPWIERQARDRFFALLEEEL
jgi:pimeloyl-ACP methyl ester carboxylesterase